MRCLSSPGPKKKHKAFKKLDSKNRKVVKVLSRILRIAVDLDKTKNQWVENVYWVPKKTN